MARVILTTILLLVICLPAANAGDCQEEHLYSTGKIMEIDRCASSWLIKRFIDPEARFAFYDDGSIITCGTAFDTPDARFTRTHDRATFEVLMEHYKVETPHLKILARAVHEAEISFWAHSQQGQLADELSRQVKAIIKANADPVKCLEACFEYFDHMLEQLEKQKR